MVLVQVNGLGRRVVYMYRREENLLSRAAVTTVARAATSPGGQAEAIVVDFGEVEPGFVLETGGSVAS
jgi:hypothetical protein